jgi:hypothetical protein
VNDECKKTTDEFPVVITGEVHNNPALKKVCEESVGAICTFINDFKKSYQQRYD